MLIVNLSQCTLRVLNCFSKQTMSGIESMCRFHLVTLEPINAWAAVKQDSLKRESFKELLKAYFEPDLLPIHQAAGESIGDYVRHDRHKFPVL